jgi:anti-anti-sigma factor
MTLKQEQLEGGIIHVMLEGTLDIEGTAALEPQLTHLTTSDRTFVVMDLAKVDFMSSIGIGALVRVVKALRGRAGNMVFLSPNQVVHLILTKTRIDSLVPILFELQDACERVMEPPPKLG